MARFRDVDMLPKFIPVNFDAQILPGTFEHALSELVDHDLDLSLFEAAFKNDAKGAPAYHPGVLLKIVLMGYSKGLTSSRAIEAACQHNIVFMALSGDTQPHFSTIAAFVSGHSAAIKQVFTEVILVCDRQGLIGREMFAIDGVKLPSNASKARSGLREDFEREAGKIERAVEKMLAEHRKSDRRKDSRDEVTEPQHRRKLERMKQEAIKIRQWLRDHPTDRKGSSKKPILSNRTDRPSPPPLSRFPGEGRFRSAARSSRMESGMLATEKGVVQGYCGVAAVDDKHQIVLSAQAHGTGSEQALLPGIVEEIEPVMKDGTAITTDAGYHSEANVEMLEQKHIGGYIADRGYRSRDPKYAGQDRHTVKDDALWDKTPRDDKPRQFKASEFKIAKDFSHCTCPAGEKLYRNGNNCRKEGGLRAMKFSGSQRTCGNCPLRARCLRRPEKTPVRQVVFFLGKHEDAKETAIERMRRKIDSPQGREMIARRFAAVEPVFGNLRHNKGLRRFTLRGREKVDAQWKLYCLVHNIEKLAHHGYAG